MSDSVTQSSPASPPDTDAIDRFLSASASHEETRAVLAWAGMTPDGAPIATLVRDALRQIPTDAIDPVHMRDMLQARLQHHRIGVPPLANGRTLRTPVSLARPRATSIAIGRLVIAAAALLGMWGVVRYVTTRPTASRETTVASAPREYATRPGQRATITLKDGTQVTLNVASRLRIAPDYGANARVVEIEGEAQFVVRHDNARPFIVRTARTAVRDLATTFVVRDYGDDEGTIVAVRDGRVAVEPQTLTPAHRVVIGAGEGVAVRVGTVPVVTPLQGAEQYFQWTSGRLVLRDAPLGAALMAMSRWYGRTVRVADDALLDSRVNTVLPEQFDVTTLAELADAIGARVRVSGSVVTFERISHR